MSQEKRKKEKKKVNGTHSEKLRLRLTSLDSHTFTEAFES